ncbi:MAG: hypothetical protein U9N51_01600, partial [Bacteroidota bacterium]|nr:hypothetical protein [Bacteroidota bacterium]
LSFNASLKRANKTLVNLSTMNSLTQGLNFPLLSETLRRNPSQVLQNDYKKNTKISQQKYSILC